MDTQKQSKERLKIRNGSRNNDNLDSRNNNQKNNRHRTNIQNNRQTLQTNAPKRIHRRNNNNNITPEIKAENDETIVQTQIPLAIYEILLSAYEPSLVGYIPAVIKALKVKEDKINIPTRNLKNNPKWQNVLELMKKGKIVITIGLWLKVGGEKMRKWFLATVILVIAFLLSSATTKVLIINVGKLEDGRIIALSGAVTDVNTFQKTILDLGIAKSENVTLLENPSLGRFSSTLNRFFTTAEPQDKLIFYYSGHGYSKDGKTYLVPSDADPDFIETTGYNLTDNLAKLLASTKSEDILLIMDACYSGSIIKDRPLAGVRVETTKIEDIIKQKGAVLLLSSGPTEVSQEKPTGGGWFTHYLIEALKGEAGKGKEWITTKDIFEYVSQNVSRQTLGKQNPMLIGTKDIPLLKSTQELYR